MKQDEESTLLEETGIEPEVEPNTAESQIPSDAKGRNYSRTNYHKQFDCPN
jgi:K+-transporting ATPase c subunit